MTDEDDPFEEFEEATKDRDGDPFDHIEAVDSDGPDEPIEQAGPEEYDAQEVTPGDHRGDTTDPLRDPFAESDDTPGDPVEDVGEGRVDPVGDPGGRRDDPFEEGGAFEEMDVDELDPDRVWEELTDAQDRGSVSKAQERTYAEVSKHSYCEQCEFFSPPPDVGCSHEGTEILEFPDMETVRVADCPVVTERKDLDRE